jgi:hypothetical protein
MKKLAAERGEYSHKPGRSRKRLTFDTVREALHDDGKPR